MFSSCILFWSGSSHTNITATMDLVVLSCSLSLLDINGGVRNH